MRSSNIRNTWPVDNTMETAWASGWIQCLVLGGVRYFSLDTLCVEYEICSAYGSCAAFWCDGGNGAVCISWSLCNSNVRHIAFPWPPTVVHGQCGGRPSTRQYMQVSTGRRVGRWMTEVVNALQEVALRSRRARSPCCIHSVHCTRLNSFVLVNEWHCGSQPTVTYHCESFGDALW